MLADMFCFCTYTWVFRGTSEEYTLTDLHPATEYTLR